MAECVQGLLPKASWRLGSQCRTINTLTGHRSLGLTGTANVNVVNSASSPALARDVDNPARRPFQTSLCFSGGSGTPIPCPASAPISFTVPCDRRLVIEFVAGKCETGPIGGTALTLLSLAIGTTVGVTNASYSLPYSFELGELDI